MSEEKESVQDILYRMDKEELKDLKNRNYEHAQYVIRQLAYTGGMFTGTLHTAKDDATVVKLFEQNGFSKEDFSKLSDQLRILGEVFRKIGR